MPNVRSFVIPTVMKHGLGAIQTLADEVRSLGVKRPLVVTDSGIVKAGLLDRATAPLKAADIGYAVFDKVAPNPPIATVDEGAGVYKSEKCDGIIGFGGGSAMDTAKAIGVVATNGGSILQYEWADPQPVKNRIPPTICVPTTAGTGSEVTLWAVITDPKRHIKFNVGGTPHIGAWVALIDPELTLDLPGPVTAGTGMDALAHAVECYTCAYAQPLPDSVALNAMEYIGQWLRVAYAQGHNVEARYKMSMAAMLGAMAYGAESAGAAHAMSQSAGGVHDVPHGALTARLLGPVMEFNYIGEPQKFARMAQALGEDIRGLSVWDAAEKAVEAVYRLTEDVEIPTLQELGFKEEEIPMLADIAFKDPQTIGNPRDLTLNSYVQIYRGAFEMGK
ncbi:MAG TPA: iron-containing alcohol dehydrogenase [Anaerolineales bacterium]|nr:iron-containing alcohol dehydrogenase [Anaerolineales bacterium]